MLCLTSDHFVYSWGSGENGILGHGDNFGLNKPHLIKSFENTEIIFIAAGDFNSAAIDIKGSLYTWGRGNYGVLGLNSEESHSLPMKVNDENLNKERVFYVSLGFCHTLIATSIYII